MPQPPPKNAGNPHQLTYKQKLVIEKVLEGSKRGKGVNLVDAHRGVYGSTKRANLANIASRNLKRNNFREALMDGLMERNIIGADSKVESVLSEGLDATDLKGNIDYEARLKYAQEINKITGVYAVEKKETARLNLNIDLTPEQINSKIRELQGELEE